MENVEKNCETMGRLYLFMLSEQGLTIYDKIKLIRIKDFSCYFENDGV